MDVTIFPGPPQILRIKFTEHPTKFSVSFHSQQAPTSVHWLKDYTPVENLTGLVVTVFKQNMTIKMYGKPLVHIDHM